MASVTFRDIEKSYGKVKVLHGLGFDIQDGEFVVLVGPVGLRQEHAAAHAGRAGGDQRRRDHDRRQGGQRPRVEGPRHRDGVPELRAVPAHDGAREHGLFSLRLRRADKQTTDQRVDNAARILNLDALLDRYPRELSGGQRQRVAMGRAIVRDPKVFLFDEPLSNLDAKLRVAMRAEIKALHQRLKTTTVYVTHDQIEAMTMADRIVVMHDGLIEQIGTPLELFDRPAQPVRRPVHRLAGDERVCRHAARRCACRPSAHAGRCPAVAASGEQAVHYGIRPTDLAPGRRAASRRGWWWSSRRAPRPNCCSTSAASSWCW